MRNEFPVLLLNKPRCPRAVLLVVPSLTVLPGAGGTWVRWYKVTTVG